MKYDVGDKLYYVNPFVFTIEMVTVSFMHDEYYCDETYACFNEEDLFDNIHDARDHAIRLLDNFYQKQMHLIKYHDPDIDIEEDILG